VRYLKLERR